MDRNSRATLIYALKLLEENFPFGTWEDEFFRDLEKKFPKTGHVTLEYFLEEITNEGLVHKKDFSKAITNDLIKNHVLESIPEGQYLVSLTKEGYELLTRLNNEHTTALTSFLTTFLLAFLAFALLGYNLINLLSVDSKLTVESVAFYSIVTVGSLFVIWLLNRRLF